MMDGERQNEQQEEGVVQLKDEQIEEGASPRRDPEQLVGIVLGGRYEIRKPLGKGGMGVVYLAHQQHLDRGVVVKVLGKGLSDQGEALQRFEREALGLSRLTHPNIVTIHDFGQDHDQAYIVMEYVDGEMLSDLMERVGRMNFDLFTSIAAQILAALSEAHRQGIIHRDIKPSNIMLCERHGTPNFVKVLDFGLVKLVDEAVEVTKKQNLVGSVSFLAPEQILGLEFDQRADVYALGVLFFYMLVGQKPFMGEDDIAVLYQHIHKDVPSIQEHLPAGHDIPVELMEVIERCLAKDPVDRPATAQQVLDEMSAVCVGPDAMRLPWVSGEFAAISRGSMRSTLPGTQLTQLTRKASDHTHQDSSTTLPTLALESSGSFATLQVQESSKELSPRPVAAIEEGETSRSEETPVPAAPAVSGLFEARAMPSRGWMLMGFAALMFVMIAGGGALMFATQSGTSGQENVAAARGTSEALEVDVTRLLAEVDALLVASKWGQAESVLDSLRSGSVTRGLNSEAQAAFLLELAAREERLEVGRLMQQAELAESREDFAKAQNHYEQVLARVPDHALANERIAAYKKTRQESSAAFGTLKVTSSPQGARVSIGDMELGETPLEVEFEPGEYVLRVQRHGYATKQETIVLEPSRLFEFDATLVASKSTRDHDRKAGAELKPRKTSPPTTKASSSKGGDDLLIPVEQPKPKEKLEDDLLPVGE